ncbi:hypothetical protein K402DRAFT_176306 [Aulographum hederae CBS 113979]|uniref:Uncharacterized protein n=1 Tax=Aulographum hederae CBS 113979 TaxID=1176131 RepID=A0A6G1GR32_9PEZI|nr:hypothetical protein K402DRAFT_176306 [Aulographum hederae CBS 113979]
MSNGNPHSHLGSDGDHRDISRLDSLGLSLSPTHEDVASQSSAHVLPMYGRPSHIYPHVLDPPLPDIIPLPSAYPRSYSEKSTPSHEIQPDLGMEGVVGVSLFSTDIGRSTSPSIKHNLRLPSFDMLGIASPHPDRIAPNPEQRFTPIGAGPLSRPDDPLHANSPALARGLLPPFSPRSDALSACSTDPPAKPVCPPTSAFTPPADPGAVDWSAGIAKITTAAMESPTPTDPEKTTPGTGEQPPSSDSSEQQQQQHQHSGADSSGAPAGSWLSAPLEAIVANLDIDGGASSSVKVLSHALPLPSVIGHCFPSVVGSIHDQLASRTTVIQLFHAIPGRFNLQDLPASPPSTPGPAIGGVDYFTSKIFDSAVPITDYQADAKNSPTISRPVVPPSSVNVSIVERYIPPTTPNEFSGMFSNPKRSLLRDRFIELSSDNGILLLIYPTKRGGRTFMDEYLGPIIDPLLRSMVVMHGLSSDLGSQLGLMPAVDQLWDYDTLLGKIEKFCREMSVSTTNDDVPKSGHHTYSILHASAEVVHPERTVWAKDWWVKQEKTRVKEAVNKYYRLAKNLPNETETMPTHLYQQVLDGVGDRPYPSGNPATGIEVGVFVIRKSS